MKKKIIAPLLAVILMISGCGTNNNDGKDALVSTTGKVDIVSIETTTTNIPEETTTLATSYDENTVSEVQSCIAFDSRNTMANDSLTEEQRQAIQYQVGTFNFIPVYFNGEYLCSDTYEEFCSLIRSSSQLLGDKEFEADDGTFVTKFNIEGGGKVLFYNKEPVSVISDAGDISPIQFQIMGVSLGDTVADINRLIGTEYVEYPTLRTLIIRDTDTHGYAQFTLDEDCKVIRMEFKFGADD